MGSGRWRCVAGAVEDLGSLFHAFPHLHRLPPSPFIFPSASSPGSAPSAAMARSSDWNLLSRMRAFQRLLRGLRRQKGHHAGAWERSERRRGHQNKACERLERWCGHRNKTTCRQGRPTGGLQATPDTRREAAMQRQLHRPRSWRRQRGGRR